jgi:molybdopterin-guanine dinucleotide biosynthesis protein A
VRVADVAGLLLTGGSSRRMGHDKATLVIDGEPSARRLGALLAEVVDPVLEVGPHCSGLAAIAEEPPGEGPLVALVAGWSALSRAGHEGSVVVLACDLPLVTAAFIRWLAQHPGERSIVPLVDGRPQPLCARWSALDLRRSAERAAHGARSFRELLDEMDAVRVGPDDWAGVALPSVLADVDTPDDLERLGLTWRPGRPADGPGSSDQVLTSALGGGLDSRGRR